MKKLMVLFLIMTFSGIAFAETTENTESQKIENENSYLGINFEKQPEEQSGKQLITNKKSFLFVNVIINGKPITVKEKVSE